MGGGEHRKSRGLALGKYTVTEGSNRRRIRAFQVQQSFEDDWSPTGHYHAGCCVHLNCTPAPHSCPDIQGLRMQLQLHPHTITTAPYRQAKASASWTFLKRSCTFGLLWLRSCCPPWFVSSFLPIFFEFLAILPLPFKSHLLLLGWQQ